MCVLCPLARQASRKEQKHEYPHYKIRNRESYECPDHSQAGGKWHTERKRDSAPSNTGPESQVWSFERPKRSPHDGRQALGERKQTPSTAATRRTRRICRRRGSGRSAIGIPKAAPGSRRNPKRTRRETASWFSSWRGGHRSHGHAPGSAAATLPARRCFAMPAWQGSAGLSVRQLQRGRPRRAVRGSRYCP